MADLAWLLAGGSFFAVAGLAIGLIGRLRGED